MIGIYAPYDLSDTTTMALSVASLAISSGYDVSYFSPTTVQTNIHSSWDAKVKSIKDMTFASWAERCDHIVWFVPDTTRLLCSRLKKCINTLVVLHDYASKRTILSGLDYDCVIFPSVAICKYLTDAWPANTKIHSLPWDTCNPISTKHSLVDSNKLWVYLPLQNTASETFSEKLFYALEVVLSRCTKVHLTIAKNKRLTYSGSNALASLQRAHNSRVRVIRKPKQDLRSMTYRQHDWTFYPASCDDVHLPAVHSLYSGTPVIGLDVSSANECIVDNVTGRLLPCDRDNDKIWNIPIQSDPKLAAMIDTLESSFNDTAILTSMLSKPWPFLETRRRNFSSVWNLIWNESIRS